MGRPRLHKTNADRQKAYRARVKAAKVGVTKGQTALVQRVMRADEEAGADGAGAGK